MFEAFGMWRDEPADRLFLCGPCKRAHELKYSDDPDLDYTYETIR